MARIVAIFLLDVLIFVALFVMSAVVLPVALHAPLWSAPVFMAISFIYAWWRGALGPVRPLWALLLVVALGAALMIENRNLRQVLTVVVAAFFVEKAICLSKRGTDGGAPSI